jgi:hypothetical protein
MVAGLLKEAVITPYVVDGWVQGGFSMYKDGPFTSKVQPTEEEIKFLNM